MFPNVGVFTVGFPVGGAFASVAFVGARSSRPMKLPNSETETGRDDPAISDSIGRDDRACVAPSVFETGRDDPAISDSIGRDDRACVAPSVFETGRDDPAPTGAKSRITIMP